MNLPTSSRLRSSRSFPTIPRASWRVRPMATTTSQPSSKICGAAALSRHHPWILWLREVSPGRQGFPQWRTARDHRCATRSKRGTSPGWTKRPTSRRTPSPVGSDADKLTARSRLTLSWRNAKSQNERYRSRIVFDQKTQGLAPRDFDSAVRWRIMQTICSESTAAKKHQTVIWINEYCGRGLNHVQENRITYSIAQSGSLFRPANHRWGFLRSCGKFQYSLFADSRWRYPEESLGACTERRPNNNREFNTYRCHFADRFYNPLDWC